MNVRVDLGAVMPAGKLVAEVEYEGLRTSQLVPSERSSCLRWNQGCYLFYAARWFRSTSTPQTERHMISG
jgi:hypothetical protein